MTAKNIKSTVLEVRPGSGVQADDGGLEPAKEKINLLVCSITSLCSGFSLPLVPSFLAFEELLLSALAD